MPFEVFHGLKLYLHKDSYPLANAQNLVRWIWMSDDMPERRRGDQHDPAIGECNPHSGSPPPAETAHRRSLAEQTVTNARAHI